MRFLLPSFLSTTRITPTFSSFSIIKKYVVHGCSNLATGPQGSYHNPGISPKDRRMPPPASSRLFQHPLVLSVSNLCSSYSSQYDFFHSLKTAINSSPSISPVSAKPNEPYSFRAASFSGSYDSQQYSAVPQGRFSINSSASLTASLP